MTQDERAEALAWHGEVLGPALAGLARLGAHHG